MTATKRKSASGTNIPASRRRDMGQTAVQIWLDPASALALKRLTTAYECSRTEAIRRALMACARLGLP